MFHVFLTVEVGVLSVAVAVEDDVVYSPFLDEGEVQEHVPQRVEARPLRLDHLTPR